MGSLKNGLSDSKYIHANFEFLFPMDAFIIIKVTSCRFQEDLAFIGQRRLILVQKSKGFSGFYNLGRCCYKCKTILIESQDVILKMKKKR